MEQEGERSIADVQICSLWGKFTMPFTGIGNIGGDHISMGRDI